MTIVGNGKQERDFIYVDDVINAILKASKSKYTNEIFNIGSGMSISINYIAKLIKGKKIYIPKRPGEPEITLADISKAKNNSHLKLESICSHLEASENKKNVDSTLEQITKFKFWSGFIISVSTISKHDNFIIIYFYCFFYTFYTSFI